MSGEGNAAAVGRIPAGSPLTPAAPWCTVAGARVPEPPRGGWAGGGCRDLWAAAARTGGGERREEVEEAMRGVRMGGMASALANGLRATPGVDPHVQQSFVGLLRDLEGPAITETEAERRMLAWLATVPPHAVAVLRSVVLAAASQKQISPDFWLYRAFVARRGGSRSG